MSDRSNGIPQQPHRLVVDQPTQQSNYTPSNVITNPKPPSEGSGVPPKPGNSGKPQE